MASQLADEEAHIKIIESTLQSLKVTPFSGCSFDLTAITSDVVTVLSSARTVEAIGVGAYIGAASLVGSKEVLSAAASILPIEARHQSALNLFAGGSLAGQAFEIGLKPEQVLAMVGGLLKGCKASDLGVTANQPLSIVDSQTKVRSSVSCARGL